MVLLAKDTAQRRTRIHRAHPAPGGAWLDL